MKQIKSENRNLWLFFLTAFAWSWLFWIWEALASHGLISSPLPSDLMELLGVFGPTFAAIILTVIYAGRVGLRELLGRLLVWRVGVQWYIFVLLWPALFSLLTTAIHILSGGSAPDFANPPIMSLYPLPPEAKTVGLLPLLVFVFLQQTFIGSSMGEEIGWRGYALPRLLKTKNALYASLILGVIWGIWHLPRFFSQGNPLVNVFFGWFFLGIVADTIFFTWIYNNTKGSLLLVLLFHTSIAITSLFLSTATTPPFIGLALKGGLIVVILRIWGPKRTIRKTNQKNDGKTTSPNNG
jgi:membrane protease YdiL (CAAX protease family)